MTNESDLDLDPCTIRAVLFDFVGVVAKVRMALIGEVSGGPYVVDLDEDVITTIQHLRKANFRTGLITNNDSSSMAEQGWLEPMQLIFDALIFGPDVGYLKPDQRIFRHALDCLGVTADQALLLDDSSRNVDSALAMGMQGVVVDRPGRAVHALARFFNDKGV